MKYIVFFLIIFALFINCSPSDEDLKKHEENRTKQLEQLDAEWEEEMNELDENE